MAEILQKLGPVLWHEFPQPLIILEEDRISFTNSKTLQIFQADSFDDLGEKSFEDLIADDSAGTGIYIKLWKQAIDDLCENQISSFECLLRRFTGELFWASVRLHGLDGKILIQIEDKSQFFSLAANENFTEIRAIRHNKALKKIAKLQATKNIEPIDLLKQSAKIIKDTLSVKQVSIWLFNKAQSRLRCVAQSGNDNFDSSFYLDQNTFPSFFETFIENNLVSINTETEYAPLGRYFQKVLIPQGIKSIMYIPIADIEKVVGIITIEHHNLRPWYLDEQSFAVSIAEVIAQSLASQDRRKIREQLFIQEKLFKTLIENSTDVFAIIDENAICNYISPSIEKLFGYKEQEILGNDGEERIHPDDRDRVLNRFKSLALDKPKAVDIIVFRYKSKEGKFHHVECVCQNQLNNPVVRGIIVNFRNIDDRIRAEKQQKENIRAQYQLLKTQVNPHFLFNCLNTLASLIYIDEEKAEDFVLKLASVYRYLLENRQDETVKLKEELNLVRNYLFLQKFRFEDNLKVNIKFPDKYLERSLIALSLQLVLENAIKHNEISKSNPLTIDIYIKQDYLVVENTFQPRLEKITSTGIGIPNIKNRYALVSNKKTKFYQEGTKYYAMLPLLMVDN